MELAEATDAESMSIFVTIVEGIACEEAGFELAGKEDGRTCQSAVVDRADEVVDEALMEAADGVGTEWDGGEVKKSRKTCPKPGVREMEALEVKF